MQGSRKEGGKIAPKWGYKGAGHAHKAGDAKLQSSTPATPSTLATSPTFPWACPTCFKKGVTAIQRAVLKPTGQGAAGAKRKRRK